MSVEKLSVSMEASLAKLVRSAASEEGVSLSTWLAEAARAKARQRALRAALADHAAEHGPLTAKAASELIDSARAHSFVSRGRSKRS
ncbi:MAG: hypothetical protein H0T89_00100 [Deltaproteobacteria bacterium]|nr:hypothetical protein [Deltaproteobacteria bacterium]MDQ3295314.1 hypothetical protein [Myxococcota bacterium]